MKQVKMRTFPERDFDAGDVSLEVEAVLSFSEHVLTNAVRLWSDRPRWNGYPKMG